MHRPTRLKIADINPHLTCILCGGYFIDATTIIECLHSFCRTCIVGYLETSKFCPICDVQVHKTKPLLNIRADKTLQDIVYKLMPGLYQNEMKRRREFYGQNNEARQNTTPEDRGEGTASRYIYSPDETISLSLEYGSRKPPRSREEGTEEVQVEDNNEKTDTQRRFLRCHAAVTVSHLKKFITMKYGISSSYMVDMMYYDESLQDDYTLMDIAYIYTWRRNGPMRLFYRILERPPKRMKLFHPENPSTSVPSQIEGVPSEEASISDVIPQPPPPPPPPSSSAMINEEVAEVVTSSAVEEAVVQTDEMAIVAAEPSSDIVAASTTESSASPFLAPLTDKCLDPIPAKDESVEKAMVENNVESNNDSLKPVNNNDDIAMETNDNSEVTMTTPPAEAETVVETPPDDTPQPPSSAEATSKETPGEVEKMDIEEATGEVSDSDDRDLGCQPDLVVDEQKVESSGDDGDGEGSDSPKKDPVDDEAEATDDTEGDSGRGSDISSRTEARSSCDDDIGSPVSTVRTPDADRTLTCTLTPDTDRTSVNSTLSPAPEPHQRSPSPPPPAPVVHRVRENGVVTPEEPQKDHIGALDLSLSHRHGGDSERPPRPRQRPVANPPVLDKHRLPTCLPAPKHHFKLLPATLPHSSFYKKSESRNHRFKGSNLTVINPDPNSFRPKIVIKNLDPRPSHGHHHHHHHHHHRL